MNMYFFDFERKSILNDQIPYHKSMKCNLTPGPVCDVTNAVNHQYQVSSWKTQEEP